jgi:hypothetical protein
MSKHCWCHTAGVWLQAGLSADEMLLQATRAWNIAVRERPHDEALWLEFAAFQHSAAQQQQQRGRYAIMSDHVAAAGGGMRLHIYSLTAHIRLRSSP